MQQSYAALEVTGGQVISNTANRGGGVYVYVGTVTVSGGQVVGNNAGRGGAVFVRSGTAAVSGGSIQGNEASLEGGGLYIETGAATSRAHRMASQ